MVNKNIQKKINNTDVKCRKNLSAIASDKIFDENEKLFDLVLSQTSKHSQNIIYEAIKEGVSNDILYLLVQNTDGYLKQERILRYSKYDSIIKNEIIFNDMLNIENEYVESELFELFRMNKIRTLDEYREKRSYFSGIANFNGIFKKEGEKLAEIDYQELKKKRILKDNVLKDVKKVLRNFGFLGIDIPRVNERDQDKNDVVRSFNEEDYQKLFNVDDFGDEKLFVNGTITNAKSNNNFAELVIIFRELLKKYHINSYNVNIYSEDIYNLIRKYSGNNINLVSDESEIIKFTANEEKEFINISRFEKNIVFNVKIDKLVDYIISEKKEHAVEEDNLRDTLIYVNEDMEQKRKLYDSLIDKYLYEYHAIIVYQEDIPREKLFDYCAENNIKFVGFLEEDNDFRVLPIRDLIKNKPKTLALNVQPEGAR